MSPSRLQRSAESEIGKVPFVLVLNKVDLADAWEVDDAALEVAHELGWKVIRTSAKTGEGVEDAFMTLARAMASR